MSVDVADRAAVAAFARKCGLAVVATVDPAGRPEAALVGIAALDDGTLIFDAPHDSRKIVNLRNAPRIAVVLGTDDVSIQLEGPAIVTEGAERLRCGTEYNRQLPGSRALGEEFAVVAIRPDWVRGYDASVHPARVVETTWTIDQSTVDRTETGSN